MMSHCVFVLLLIFSLCSHLQVGNNISPIIIHLPLLGDSSIGLDWPGKHAGLTAHVVDKLAQTQYFEGIMQM